MIRPLEKSVEREETAMDTDFDAAATRIMDFYRTFSDDKVEEFKKLSSPEIHWEDPFGEETGIDKVIAIMHSWSKGLSDIEFEIKDYSRNEKTLFLHMLLKFQVRKMPGKDREIDYVKKVVFNDAGLVVNAKEYWDVTPALESLPVLGKVVSLAKKMMKKQFS
jgi:hypothetical protein